LLPTYTSEQRLDHISKTDMHTQNISKKITSLALLFIQYTEPMLAFEGIEIKSNTNSSEL